MAAKVYSGRNDRFGGKTISVPPGRDSEEQFVARMGETLRQFRTAGVRGVWLRVEATDVAFVPHAMSRFGFVLHHARPECVMMTLWLPDDGADENKLPPYAYHYVGVGGLVFNERGEILVVTGACRRRRRRSSVVRVCCSCVCGRRRPAARRCAVVAWDARTASCS